MIKKYYLNFLNFSLLFSLGILLTIIFTWPFARELNDFYYDNGEYQLSGAIMAYNARSILSGKIFDQESYFNGFQLYPQPLTLAYTDLRLLSSILFLLVFSVISFLLTQVDAFILSINLVTLLSFILSFVTSFYVINYFVKNRLAALVGAVVFTFNPITFAKMPEHFEYLSKYLLPLVFLYAFKFFKVPTLKSALIFFFVLILNAFSTIYYQIFTFILLPFFALPFLVSNFIKKEKTYFIRLVLCSLTFVIFLPIFLYFNSPYLELSKKEGVNRSLAENAFFSARLIDYISAPPNNWLYQPLVKVLEPYRAPKDLNDQFNYLEHSLSLNIIPLCLLGFFVWKFLKRKEKKPEENLIFYSFGVLLVTAFILTLGPFFQGWNSSQSNLSSPFYFLYQHLPLLKGIRVPTRAQFIFYVPFSLFISFGASYLFTNFSKLSKQFVYLIVLVILFGLFLENFAPSIIGRGYESNSRILAEVKVINAQGKRFDFLKEKATLHIPTLVKDPGNTAIYLNWAALTGEKIVNGNWGSFVPPFQAELLLRLEEKLDENMLKSLQALKVEYIIFHKDLHLEKYIEFIKLFPEGVVYEDSNIAIVEIAKLNLNLKRCDYEKDININIQPVLIPSSIQSIFVAQINNNSDCYLSSVYREKYRNIKALSTNFFGMSEQKTFNLNFPPIISPADNILLSETNKTLIVE